MAEKYSFIVVRYPKKDTAEAALEVARSGQGKGCQAQGRSRPHQG